MVVKWSPAVGLSASLLVQFVYVSVPGPINVANLKLLSFHSQILQLTTDVIVAVWSVDIALNLTGLSFHGIFYFEGVVVLQMHVGQVIELWLSCYLVLLSTDSKTR